MKKITLIIGCVAFLGLNAMASTGSKELQEQASYSSKLNPVQLTPTTVKAVEISPSKELITWKHEGTASAYVVKYAIERPDARTEQKVLNVVNATAYTLTDLEPGTTYNYWVKAVTREGESNWSEKATFTTLNSCAKPLFVEATEISNSKAVISWHSSAAGSEFIVRYTDGGEYPILNHERVKANAGINYFELNNLNANSNYHFWVKSVCSESKSDWSSKTSFTTPSIKEKAQLSNITDLSEMVDVQHKPTLNNIEITISKNIPAYIEIADVTGRMVYKNENSNYSGDNTVVVNTNDFNRGLYIVTIRSEDSVHIQKFMVQ